MNMKSKTCAICLEKISFINKKRTHCNHFFHKKCLNKWLSLNPTCPLCKDLLKYSSVLINKKKFKIIIENIDIVLINEISSLESRIPFRNIQTIYRTKDYLKINKYNENTNRFDNIVIYTKKYLILFNLIKDKIEQIEFEDRRETLEY